MKNAVAFVCLSLLVSGASALPKLGYYKARYSSGQGAVQCTQVLSNTKQVTILGRKVTYFEFANAGGTTFACIPQAFFDTDADDGDPKRYIFTSLSSAYCTADDGNVSIDVTFDATHVFWTGDSYGKVTLPDRAIPAIGKVKERQTNYSEFFSTTGCP